MKTLYAKLSLGLIVILVTIGLVYGFINRLATTHYLQELNQQLNHDLAQNLVADRNLVAEGKLNEKALEETFHQYMVINPSIEIYLLSLSGKILSYSADTGQVKRKNVSLKPIQQFLEMDHPYPLLGDDPKSHDKQKPFSVTTVPSSNEPEGYLYVVLRGAQYDQIEEMAQSSFVTRLSTIAVLVSLGLGLIAGLVVFHLLTRRLHRLSNAMEQFQESGFTQNVISTTNTDRSSDEVDRLTDLFEQMSVRIQSQLTELKNQDAMRRSLIAQVSHDLRTPLASIMGYIESLEIKKNTLTSEQRDQFLSIAHEQGKQLNRLINELFELTSLDAQEKSGEIEPFAVFELLSDNMQKFNPEAEAKGINLELEFTPDLPFAMGDVGFTERVLGNLISNALEHTPEKGVISLKAQHIDKKIKFVIQNDGNHIPQEDIENLFKPYYQRHYDHSNSNHSGLGLAIAKRLMELQHGNIGVINAQGPSVQFIFYLPVS